MTGSPGSWAASIAKPLLRDMLACAEEAVAGGSVVADLRFGHGEGLMPLAALMRLEGACGVESDPEKVENVWNDFRITPMAGNIQLIFYRNAKARACQVPAQRAGGYGSRRGRHGSLLRLEGRPQVLLPHSEGVGGLVRYLPVCGGRRLPSAVFRRGGSVPWFRTVPSCRLVVSRRTAPACRAVPSLRTGKSRGGEGRQGRSPEDVHGGRAEWRQARMPWRGRRAESGAAGVLGGISPRTDGT